MKKIKFTKLINLNYLPENNRNRKLNNNKRKIKKNLLKIMKNLLKMNNKISV